MAIHADDMIVDKNEQLSKVENYCLPNEVIRAVFDMKGGGTGFIGITNKRIIFYDKAFMRKKKAMVSILYSRIHAISSEDDSSKFKPGFFTNSTLGIHSGNDTFEFEFRGGDKAHQAYMLIMEHLIG